MSTTSTASTSTISTSTTTTTMTGQGSCLVFWDLTSSGAVTVNLLYLTSHIISISASFALPHNVWTHIAQTFSLTSETILYINGTVVTSGYVSGGRAIGPFTIIGESPADTNNYSAGIIAAGQFYGSVDEYRVFGRQLMAAAISYVATL
ncbi:unnamed protein product [Rotaria sp. Silwood1]|nr:unnamed protein product [Rotaria sp. Silwood1]